MRGRERIVQRDGATVFGCGLIVFASVPSRRSPARNGAARRRGLGRNFLQQVYSRGVVFAIEGGLGLRAAAGWRGLVAAGLMARPALRTLRACGACIRERGSTSSGSAWRACGSRDDSRAKAFARAGWDEGLHGFVMRERESAWPSGRSRPLVYSRQRLPLRSRTRCAGAAARAPLPIAVIFQRLRQKFSGVGVRVARHLLGRAGGDDLAAARAALRAQIDHPVGGFDDVEIVLDDHDRGAALRAACERRSAASGYRRSAGPVVGSSKM